MLNLHIVGNAILLLTNLNLMLRKPLNVLLWHQGADLFDCRA